MDLHQVNMLKTLERVVMFLSERKTLTPENDFKSEMLNFVRRVRNTMDVPTFNTPEKIRNKYQNSFNDLKTRFQTLGITALTVEYMAAVNVAGSDVRQSFSDLLCLFLKYV
jgi:hypothetical protein